MKTVKEYLEQTFDPNNRYFVRKHITCNDGFTISVQGGTNGHYCSPREYCNIYDKVECGYPSEEESLLIEFAENPNLPTQTVYPCVPIDIVESVILKHGGIKITEIP